MNGPIYVEGNSRCVSPEVSQFRVSQMFYFALFPEDLVDSLWAVVTRALSATGCCSLVPLQ